MASYLQLLPLYKGHGIEQQDCFKYSDGHLGLLFDRFFGAYTDKWKIDKAVGKGTTKVDNGGGKPVSPMSWLNGKCGCAKQIDRHINRQVALVMARAGEGISCKTDWHFVTGLGEAHPLENGFAWHHSLGTPYLPGSSVKGMLRAYLTEWAADTFTPEELLAIFGNEREAGDGEQCAGEFIFFDALPLTQPSLLMDIMTPHAGDWYAKGASDAGKAHAVPADWHDPLPISFLVVQQARFLFTLAPRSGVEHSLTNRVTAALGEALSFMGAGAKTAAGYGQMSPLPDSDKHSWGKLTAIVLDAARQQQDAEARKSLSEAGLKIHELRAQADDSNRKAENSNIAGSLRILLKNTVEFVAANGTDAEKQQLRKVAADIAQQHWGTKIRDNKNLKELIKKLG